MSYSLLYIDFMELNETFLCINLYGTNVYRCLYVKKEIIDKFFL